MGYEEECVRQIDEAVAYLRKLLEKCSTLSVTSQCFAFHLLKGNHGSIKTLLSSPAKQISFLLGILLQSTEPTSPKELSKAEWEQAEQYLEQAFSSYMLLFFPTEGERKSLSKEWYRVRQVAMPTFLHFFNTGLIASSEQVRTRIDQTLVPFDNELEQIIGIRPTHALEICNWISERLQAGLDQVTDLAKEEQVARELLLDQASPGKCKLENIRSAADKSGYSATLKTFVASLAQIGRLHYEDLSSAFPVAGPRFWQLFSIGRGEGTALRYPIDRSIADLCPLIRLSEAAAICPLANTLFSAVLQTGEDTLTNNHNLRKRYFELRDRIHETNTAKLFQPFFGSNVEFHSNVFETPDRQHEHDLVIVANDICLIVESKASPPVEPFRNPEKAFTRIRDAFRSDTGIQKAYIQGMRIWRRLTKGESVVLYNQKGQITTQLSPDLASRTFCVCLTFHDYGPLATDLALLLEKKENEPYPWALNVFDLEALGEAWKYFGWAADDLKRYLQQRIQLHGKVFSDDELVFAGSWIHHGDFNNVLMASADLIALNPNYSDVFDDLYKHLRHGAPKVDLIRTPPVLMDLGKSLRTGNPVWVEESGNNWKKKIGRNDPCPCGSRSKYKKCHGR